MSRAVSTLLVDFSPLDDWTNERQSVVVLLLRAYTHAYMAPTSDRAQYTPRPREHEHIVVSVLSTAALLRVCMFSSHLFLALFYIIMIVCSSWCTTSRGHTAGSGAQNQNNGAEKEKNRNRIGGSPDRGYSYRTNSPWYYSRFSCTTLQTFQVASPTLFTVSSQRSPQNGPKTVNCSGLTPITEIYLIRSNFFRNWPPPSLSSR